MQRLQAVAADLGSDRGQVAHRQARSRPEMSPLCSARCTSAARLLFCGEVLDAELLKQRAQVRLDGLDAEKELVGDLLVRGRRRVRRAVLERATERDEHLALGLGQVGGDEHVVGDHRALRGGGLAGRAVQHDGAPEAQHVAVAQAPAPVDALAVDERAVARQAVVDERPLAAARLELGVHAGHLAVPRQAQPDGVAPADPDRLVAERDDALLAVAVAMHEKRVAARARPRSAP